MAQKIHPTASTPPPLVSIEVPYADLTFEHRLGGGGFGDVFKGTWKGVAVAIKKLKIMDLVSSGLEEFKQEALLMSQLRHPHIVNFFKVCLEPGNYCIVMELCEKGTLYHWLRTPEATWPPKKRIALEVALGLAYLHSHRIVHRDLKSPNILLDARLQAKIADFGLSKLRMETSLTSARLASVVGTLRWNPPELLSGDVLHHSEETDIYSFGILVLEIATGEIPFAQQLNEQIVGMWIMQGKKEKIPDDTPPEIKVLIERCRDESRKRPTAGDAVKALDAKAPAAASPIPPAPTEPISLATPVPRNLKALIERCRDESIKRPAAGDAAKALDAKAPAAASPIPPAPTEPISLATSVPRNLKAATEAPFLAIEIIDKGPEQILLELVKAAEEGDAEAQYKIGLCLQKGEEVPQDKVEAVKWYRMAAEVGHADAQYRLGLCYNYALGISKDEKEAVKWLLKAAEQGHRDAPVVLVNCYLMPNGVMYNKIEAVKWHRKAAELGDAKAQLAVGLYYYEGFVVEKSHQEALKWYRKAAAQEIPDAQYRLGWGYYYGEGVAKDYNEAAKWFQKAAEHGHAKSQNCLGECYKWGHGTTTDSTEAAKWYRKAAEQGIANAKTNLAFCLYNGEGGDKDFKEAVKLLEYTANLGDDDAKYLLGMCYQYGKGVNNDKKKATELFLEAAGKGHINSIYMIGENFSQGWGVEFDEEEAIKWLEKAANLDHLQAKKRLPEVAYSLARRIEYYGRSIPSSGNVTGFRTVVNYESRSSVVKWYQKAADLDHPEAKARLANAQYDLGFCLKNGSGMEKRPEEAKRWLQKAAEQGHVEAQKELDKSDCLIS